MIPGYSDAGWVPVVMRKNGRAPCIFINVMA